MDGGGCSCWNGQAAAREQAFPLSWAGKEDFNTSVVFQTVSKVQSYMYE